MKQLFYSSFLAFILVGCAQSKLDLCKPFIGDTQTTDALKEMVINQIDSVYQSKEHLHEGYKKQLKSHCVNDSVMEVQTQSKIGTEVHFYFNENFHLIEVIHVLPEVH